MNPRSLTITKDAPAEIKGGKASMGKSILVSPSSPTIIVSSYNSPRSAQKTKITNYFVFVLVVGCWQYCFGFFSSLVLSSRRVVFLLLFVEI